MEFTTKSSFFPHYDLVFRSRESGHRQSNFAGTSDGNSVQANLWDIAHVSQAPSTFIIGRNQLEIAM